MTKVKPTGDKDCSDCAWDYEGECNILEISGYDGYYARDDPKDEYSWLPCKCRIEYQDLIDWFVKNIDLVIGEE
jgi:hypothetical protein